eukprot:725543-Pyramimonas_sp.AAC.2
MLSQFTLQLYVLPCTRCTTQVSIHSVAYACCRQAEGETRRDLTKANQWVVQDSANHSVALSRLMAQ